MSSLEIPRSVYFISVQVPKASTRSPMYRIAVFLFLLWLDLLKIFILATELLEEVLSKFETANATR